MRQNEPISQSSYYVLLTYWFSWGLAFSNPGNSLFSVSPHSLFPCQRPERTCNCLLPCSFQATTEKIFQGGVMSGPAQKMCTKGITLQSRVLFACRMKTQSAFREMYAQREITRLTSTVSASRLSSGAAPAMTAMTASPKDEFLIEDFLLVDIAWPERRSLAKSLNIERH